jgi:hypothetical protein
VVGGKLPKKHVSGEAHESTQSLKPEGLPKMCWSRRVEQGRRPEGYMVYVHHTSISSTEEDDWELGSQASSEVWRPAATPCTWPVGKK